jgi:hypothetical protein
MQVLLLSLAERTVINISPKMTPLYRTRKWIRKFRWTLLWYLLTAWDAEL